MKQGLQLHHTQLLALTPQLQHSIRLLQLSTLEFNQEIEKILLDNPLLERLDDPMDHAVRLHSDGAINTHSEEKTSSNENSAPELRLNDQQENQDDDTPNWNEVNRGYTNHDDDEGSPQLEEVSQSLREYLLDQANLNTRTDRDAALLCFLIEALDENGYLDESLEQILASLPVETGIDQDDLVFALNFLQSLEPAGVGARSASECLALQINRLPYIPLDIRQRALTIVQNHLPHLAQHDFNKIKKALQCNDQDLRAAQEVIQQCQPYPGQNYRKDRIDFIIPDVITSKSMQGWKVHLNTEVLPKLQINSLYVHLLKQQHNAASLQTQLQEARWLISHIRQRFETILRVSEAIVERQRNFFYHGAVAMRPLVLREIADTLGLHESTISRVTTQKYMLTPHGLFELKYFFGSHISTEAGGAASATAIKTFIKQLIGAENPKDPLSDSKIAQMLKEQGMLIARRTVAKYREALKISPVNLRKVI